jgi:hypothetical protein
MFGFLPRRQELGSGLGTGTGTARVPRAILPVPHAFYWEGERPRPHLSVQREPYRPNSLVLFAQLASSNCRFSL